MRRKRESPLERPTVYSIRRGQVIVYHQQVREVEAVVRIWTRTRTGRRRLASGVVWFRGDNAHRQPRWIRTVCRRGFFPRPVHLERYPIRDVAPAKIARIRGSRGRLPQFQISEPIDPEAI